MSNVIWLASVTVGLAVAIVVLVWSWYQIRAWCWDGDDPAADAGAFLTALRESSRQGEVSDEEFRSIQSRLATQIEGTLSTPTKVKNSEAIAEEPTTGESDRAVRNSLNDHTA